MCVKYVGKGGLLFYLKKQETFIVFFTHFYLDSLKQKLEPMIKV